MYIYISTHTYICIHIYIHTMCIHIHVYIYMYTHDVYNVYIFIAYTGAYEPVLSALAKSALEK